MLETDAVAESISAARRALAAAAERLERAGARDELLTELTERRTLFGRHLQLETRRRVWRLGELAIDGDGTAWAMGEVVQTAEPGPYRHVSGVVQTRRELRTLARKAGIPDGETIIYDAEPIAWDELAASGSSGPVVLADGGVRVRFSRAAPEATTPLPDYLADRVALLVEPPAGA